MSDRERYFELVRRHPELFVNPLSAGITFELEPERIDQIEQAHLLQRLQARRSGTEQRRPIPPRSRPLSKGFVQSRCTCYHSLDSEFLTHSLVSLFMWSEAFVDSASLSARDLFGW